jgi:glycosyltransferase involved in cell wall biosynthesis
VKALFIGPNLAAGGAERVWSILLPGLRDRGIDARLLALDGGGPFEEPLRDAGVPVDIPAIRFQADVFRLYRSQMLRSFRPDVVVSRGVSGLYVGALIGWGRRCRHIYNDHRQVDFPLSRRREFMTRRVAKHLDRVILVTEDQTHHWTARGVDPGRISIIPNGTVTPTLREAREVIRHELAISPTDVVAVLIAQLRPEKRAEDFVEAVAAARARSPNLRGFVVGNGPAVEKVLSAIRPDSGVDWLGHREDVPRILAAADILVLPSEREAVPMAILEAMAAGLPVIATAVGSVAKLVEDRVTGYLVPPQAPDLIASKLTFLADNPEVRLELGRRGQEVQRRQWDASPMVERYIQLLREVSER